MTAYYPARGSAERMIGQAQGAAGHVHPGYVQHFLGDVQPPNPRGGDMWTRGGSVEFAFTDLSLNAEPIDDFFIYEDPGGIISMRFVLPDGASDVQALSVKLAYAVADATYASGTPQLDLILNSGTTLQVPLDGATDDLLMVELEVAAPADWLALAENESFLDVDYAVLPDEIALYDLSIELLRTGFVYSFDGAQWVLMSTGGDVIESHNQLIGREAINSHPIAAITDLQTTLDGKTEVADFVAGSGIDITNNSGVLTIDNLHTSHASLSGLGSDDHPQYLDATRGYTRTLANQTFVNVAGDTVTGLLTTTDLAVKSPDATHPAIELQDSIGARLAEIGATTDNLEVRAVDGTMMAEFAPDAAFIHGRIDYQPDNVAGTVSITAGSGAPDNTVVVNGMGLYVDITAGTGPLWYTTIPGDNSDWATIGVAAHDHDGTYVTLADHGAADHSTLLANKADIAHVTSSEDPAGTGDLLHVQYPSIQPSDLALSSAIGVSDTLARADHVHKRPTLAELNAAAAAHDHDASDIATGTIAFARLPTGTTSSTVAIGNHTHAYVPTSRNIGAGAGLTGGGALTTDRTLSIGAGTGITVNADSVEINRTTVDSWYSASGHGHTGTDDHAHAGHALTTTEVIAGGGLTGGGTLAADRTLAVGAGTGITVAADAVSVDRTAVDAWYEPIGEVTSQLSTHTTPGITPDPHTQYQLESQKGAANGYAPLGADSKVPSANLPAARDTNYFQVADATARKTATSYSPDGLYKGDTVFQASDATSWVYTGDTEPADQTAVSNDANWFQQSAGGVTSVNSDPGPAVVLAAADVGAPPTSRTITAGSGLTGGGDFSANRTINVGAGTGISVAADSVAVDRAQTDTWYSLAGHTHSGSDDHTHAAYVPTTRSLTAGSGLTGGGTLASNRTFNVGAGTGISVAADAVSINRTTVDAWYEAAGTVASAISAHHASNSTDHDDRYYTETEVDSLLSGKEDTHTHPYVNVAGDTMSGELRITDDFSASGMVRNGSDPASFATKPGAIWIREDDDTGAADPIFDPADYAAVGHLHAGIYSPVGHTHAGDFATSGHTHTGYANETHAHAGYVSTGGDTITGNLDVNGTIAQAGLVRTSDPPNMRPGLFWVDEADTGSEISQSDPASHHHDAAYSPVTHDHSGDHMPVDRNLIPWARVRRTSNQTITRGTGDQHIDFDTGEVYGGMTWNSDGVTVPEDGYYQALAMCNAPWNQTGGGTNGHFTFTVAGFYGTWCNTNTTNANHRATFQTPGEIKWLTAGTSLYISVNPMSATGNQTTLETVEMIVARVA